MISRAVYASANLFHQTYVAARFKFIVRIQDKIIFRACGRVRSVQGTRDADERALRRNPAIGMTHAQMTSANFQYA